MNFLKFTTKLAKEKQKKNAKEFVNGLTVKAPSHLAPSYIKCKVNVNRQKLIEWLKSKEGEWVNLSVNVSSRGNWYAHVDHFKQDEKLTEDNRRLMEAEERLRFLNSLEI